MHLLFTAHLFNNCVRGVGESLLLDLPARLSRGCKMLVLDCIDACCTVDPSQWSADRDDVAVSITELTQTAALKMCIDRVLETLPDCTVVGTAVHTASLDAGLLLPCRFGTVMTLEALDTAEREQLISKAMGGFELMHEEIGGASSDEDIVHEVASRCQVLKNYISPLHCRQHLIVSCSFRVCLEVILLVLLRG